MSISIAIIFPVNRNGYDEHNKTVTISKTKVNDTNLIFPDTTRFRTTSKNSKKIRFKIAFFIIVKMIDDGVQSRYALNRFFQKNTVF